MEHVKKQTCRLIIEITETDGKRTSYSVTPIKSEIEEHRRAYQVKKLSDGTVYHLTQSTFGLRQCDCGAMTFGNKACKHLRSCTALGLFLTTKELAEIERGKS